MRIIVLTVFNPAFPDQILVQFGDRLNIYHSPDFTLLKEIKREDEMTLEDIDPSTGNLLFYNSKRLKIVDSQSGQELLAMDAATFPWVHLLGNTLVSFDGFVFNIESIYRNETIFDFISFASLRLFRHWRRN